MLKELRVTLYDIFGYLLPGTILLTATAILFWAIFFPKFSLPLIHLNFQILGLILLLSYFSGHATQAIGNLIEKFFLNNFSCLKSIFSEDFIHSLKSKASLIFNIDLNNISPELLYNICDETIVQYGITEDREVYQYREGFYRGLTVSLLLLSLSLILRTIIPGTSIEISDSSQYHINCYILFFFILISLVGSLLALLRYKRFSRYRITRAILGFLILQGKKDLYHSKKE